MSKENKDKVEYGSAVMCLVVACSCGVSAMSLSKTNTIESGVLIFIAQLLLFSASVFHLNYKLGSYGESKCKDDKK